MILSICIPSVIGREAGLNRLLAHLQKQVADNGLENEVEIITDVDNKEVSIGAKRDRMYRACKGKYAVQIDDDDWVADDFVKEVRRAAMSGCDCIGYQEHCLMDGAVKMSDFSLRYNAWQEYRNGPNKFGFNHLRTPFTKTPILTEICRRVGVSDSRFGEDHDFAKRVHPYLKSEEYINKVMYYYTSNSLTRKQHNERYGIQSK